MAYYGSFADKSEPRLRRVSSQISWHWQEVTGDGSDEDVAAPANPQESDGTSLVKQGNSSATPCTRRPEKQPPISNVDLQATAFDRDVRGAADGLRDEVCFTRVKLDSVRDRSMTLRGFMDDAYGELASFLDVNTHPQQAPQSTGLQLQRLRQQAKAASDAFLDQSGVVREVEADLRELEARIWGLGVWFVHIPEDRMNLSDDGSFLACSGTLSREHFTPGP